MHRVSPPAPRPCQHHFSSKRDCLGHLEWSEHTSCNISCCHQRAARPRGAGCKTALLMRVAQTLKSVMITRSDRVNTRIQGRFLEYPDIVLTGFLMLWNILCPRALGVCLQRLPSSKPRCLTCGLNSSPKPPLHVRPSKQYVKWIASQTGQLTTNMPGHHTWSLAAFGRRKSLLAHCSPTHINRSHPPAKSVQKSSSYRVRSSESIPSSQDHLHPPQASTPSESISSLRLT